MKRGEGDDPPILSPTHPYCIACDRLAVWEVWCFPCAAAEELRPSEDERVRVRDAIATLLTDGEGTPRYDMADAIWLTIYKLGFDVMRRPTAPMGPPA